MKKALTVFAVVLSVGLTAAFDAEAARRLGGGKSSGMQRDSVSAPAPARNQPGTPAQAQPAAPAAAPAAATAANAAAAPAKRSWLGPVAGIAAGLGLAALASHFGFAEELASFMLIGLLVLAVLVVVGLIMRRRAGGATPSMAGAGAGNATPASPLGMQRTGLDPVEPAAPRTGSLIGSGIGSGLGVPAAAAAIPADFDVAGFTRGAQANFLALQQANDARDLDRLREYLTPEMFDVVKADLADRGDAPQKTEVFGLSTQVLAVAEEGDRYIVSVRFTGSIRHEAGAPIEDLAEVWHLVKPRTGAGGWVIAGIQQG